jgi:RHS repeat-associated protein
LPSVSLPKAGGAIRGVSEKLAVEPVTGTARLSVPLDATPGRGGVGPQFALGYDSGAGNGPYGLGWSVAVPAIRRKTDNGLPRYRDDYTGGEEADVFVYADAEDLVPTLAQQTRAADGRTYEVAGFRPRLEGLYARIERWTDAASGESHWRVISHDNVTTRFGTSAESRIADPEDPRRVFAWLAAESFDDRGNALVFRYKAEDSTGVDASRPHERNRTPAGRAAQRYPKRVQYGNRTPRRPGEDLLARTDWLFELVFDYGEHYAEEDGVPTLVSAEEALPWPVRGDAFSSYRAGFELRTYRLCRRILQFHCFPQKLGTQDCLVRAIHLDYSEGPVASFLAGVTRSGYVRRPDGSYLKRSFPRLELEYSKARLDPTVREVDADSLANLPVGLAGRGTSWVDLDGDGVAGVLADDGGAWLYKRNLSPLDGTLRLAPEREVVVRPLAAAAPATGWHWLDVGGDGQLDLVRLGGRASGFHERAPDGGWEPFAPFPLAPTLDFGDANLGLVDLTGDGRADVLLTEDDRLVWYRSRGEDGFDEAETVRQAPDEEASPRLLLADGTQSVHLVDLSGDGLADLVRVRNGEVCYWPSLGHGRFGAKVTMDDAPWLDGEGAFDPRRVRLADVDGSGPTDLVYLAADGVRVYANRAGNGFAPPVVLEAFPPLDSLEVVHVVDALGNGTACLVWASPLPSAEGRQLRYVDLVGGKPHLLTRVANNLGAETRIAYAPSTRFSLADERAGRPWATRLPFPVQVVERVETYDWIGRSRFVTRYAYHHGYYDALEREFRGFGLVEHWDTEEHRDDITFPAAVNWAESSWSPPALTRSWFHTGAFALAGTISRHLAGEYWVETALRPDARAADRAAMELPDSLLPDGLAPDELREAYRALKGAPLRVEVYGEDGSARAGNPYAVTERCFAVRLVQAKGNGRHAVFATHLRETLELRYERRADDPRASHEVVLEVDAWGNVLRSVAIGYPRRPGYPEPEPSLAPAFRAMLAYDQGRLHVTAAEQRFTNAIDDPAVYPDAHRAPFPAESLSAELTGIAPAASRPGVTNLFRAGELDALWTALWTGARDAAYEDVPAADVDGAGAAAAAPTRRIIGRTRTLYRRDDLAGLLPPGQLQPRALAGESYRLGLTDGLVARVLGGLATPATLAEGGYVQLPGEAGWWLPSGRVFYSPGAADPPADELAAAAAHFFRPRRSVDPFGAVARVDFDPYDLLVTALVDPVRNTTSAEVDYRVLRPFRLTDANGNRSEDAFDALGLVVGTAVRGKAAEAVGDSLAGFKPDLDEADALAHLADPLANPGPLLADATSRVVYDLFAYVRTRDDPEPQPCVTCTLARVTHVSDLAPGEATRFRHELVYADGFGREAQRKMQAEPGPVADTGPPVDPRWVGSGWTVYDNKGNAVRSYEPFFSARHGFEFARTVGVATTRFYDPPGRTVATLRPDDTWTKRVVDAWREEMWDEADTVLADPAADADVGAFFQRAAAGFQSWYDRRVGGAFGTTAAERAAQQDAAQKAAAHAATPAAAHLDALGRTCLTVADGGAAGRLPARVGRDCLGAPLGVVDALGRRAAEHCVREPQPGGGFRYLAGHDLAGNALYRNGMDDGERRALVDVAGNPVRTSDARGHVFRTQYDALRRQTHRWVATSAAAEILLERIIYGEGQPDRNLCGRIFRRYDGAGAAISERYDFKGNLIASTRALAAEHRVAVDWSPLAALAEAAALDAAAAPLLRAERFAGATWYDALDRPVQAATPHTPAMRPNVLRTTYDQRGLVRRVDVWLRAAAKPAGLLDPAAADLHAVAALEYDAHGRRRRLELGNGTITKYAYDLQSFRLARLTTTRAGAAAPVLQDLTYAYDPVGNVTRIRDDADLQNVVFFRNRRVDPTADYTYDAVYRLTRATGREHLGQAGVGLAAPQQVASDDSPRTGILHPGDGLAVGTYTEKYAYDAVGNLLTVAHQVVSGSWTRRYAYAAPSQVAAAETSNRLTATSLPGDPDGGPFGATYSYDAHGNTTRMPHLPALAWSEEDQLRSTTRQVTSGGTPETTYYVYDAGGGRVRKVTERSAPAGAAPTARAERIYLGGLELHRELGPGGDAVTLERETLHVLAGARVTLVETRTAGEDPAPAQLVRYQYGNHLGSALLELDATAAVISYEEYFPHGSSAYQAVRSQTETPKRYRYTGKERDEESDLAYHGARYYAPWLGRWTSCDPAGLVDGVDVYAYARGSPTTFSDPGGTQSQPPDFDTYTQQTFGAPPPPTEIKVNVGPKSEAARELERRRKDPTDTLPGPAPKPAPKKSFGEGVGDEAKTVIAEKARQALSPAAKVVESYEQGGVAEAAKTVGKLEVQFSPPAMAYNTVKGIFTSGAEFADKFGEAATTPDDYQAGQLAVRAADAAMSFAQSMITVAEADRLPEAKEPSGEVGGPSSAGAMQAKPTVRELRSAKRSDAHHIIQDAAVWDVPGYKTGDAPGVQLQGPAAKIGSPHYEATQVQRTAGIGGTYGAERQVAGLALTAAGMSIEEVALALARADAYFIDQLGLSLDYPLRIPGNRMIP